MKRTIQPGRYPKHIRLAVEAAGAILRRRGVAFHVERGRGHYKIVTALGSIPMAGTPRGPSEFVVRNTARLAEALALTGRTKQ